MKTDTKYFGEITIDDTQVLSFPEGVPGLEKETKYALIPFFEEGDDMVCLQALGKKELALVLLNPFCVDMDYEPRLTDADLDVLQSDKDTPLLFYVPAVVKEQISETTVNMKCPIAINPSNHLGKQVIMEDERYSMRAPLCSKEALKGQEQEKETKEKGE